MKFQPNRDYDSNDDVMTPLPLCNQIVNHFKPSGKILEPCCGTGNFCSAIQAFNGSFSRISYGDIKYGQDFLGEWGNSFKDRQFEHIYTNPPWSLIRPFLKQSFRIADNVVMLFTANHAMTTARWRDMQEANFGIKEILLVDWPKEFKKAGFLLGAIHYKRGYNGKINIVDGRKIVDKKIKPNKINKL